MFRTMNVPRRWLILGLAAVSAAGLATVALAQSPSPAGAMVPMTPSATGTMNMTPPATATMTMTAMPSMTATVPPVASAPPQPTDRLITAELLGASEIPPVTTTATGSFRATLEDNQLCFTLGADGTGLTMAHIHHGNASQVGDPVVDLFMDMHGVSNILTSGCIAEANLQGSLAGNWDGFGQALNRGDLYVNVLSLAHPGGEMRGQILTGTDRFMPTVAPTPNAPVVGSGSASGVRPSDAWFFGGSIVAMFAVALLGGWLSLGRRR